MGTIGQCPMCQRQKIQLTEHHIIEAPDANGKVHTIDLCEECHVSHERYRNYLRDICGIEIDKTKVKK